MHLLLPPIQLVMQVLDDCVSCGNNDLNLEPEAYR
jgi:hypothetical protein